MADARDAERRFAVTREFQVFESYITPLGFLTRDRACHALFRYYLSARYIYEKERDNLLAFEGEKDTDVNYRQLFSSWARAYGVDPRVMAKFWLNVDMQCDAVGIPRMPDEERYRFNRPIVIKVEEPSEKETPATGKDENAASK